MLIQDSKRPFDRTLRFDLAVVARGPIRTFGDHIAQESACPYFFVKGSQKLYNFSLKFSRYDN